MIFNKDSAFRTEAEQMSKFFERWEQSTLNFGAKEETHKLAEQRKDDEMRRTAGSEASFHLAEAQYAIEALATRLPMEFQRDLIEISRHVEDAQSNI